MQTAMLGHLPYMVLRDAILTHPTMSGGLKLAVGQRSGEGHANAGLKRFKRFTCTDAVAQPRRR